MLLVTGFNLFGQWLKREQIIKQFNMFNICEENTTLNDASIQVLHADWSYNIFAINNSVYISGLWVGEENVFRKALLPLECDDIDNLQFTGNNYQIILLNRKKNKIWRLLFSECNHAMSWREISVHNTEVYLDEVLNEKINDNVIKVAQTNHSCFCLTSGGNVYEIPLKINTNHCVGKVCDIACGYEHTVLLTDMGNVYTWGNGRRCQLGHGDLTNSEVPLEVEALSGINIVKIKTGGWHTLALSDTYDVYAWGWNDTGQLGIREMKNEPQEKLTKESSEFELKDLVNTKDETFDLNSHALPVLIDFYDENSQLLDTNVKDVACGSRHSVVLLSDNTVWCTGFNKYGQLGLNPDVVPSLNYFKKSYQCLQDCSIYCGLWCTFIKNK